MTGSIPVVRHGVDRVESRWHGTPIRTRVTAAAAVAATFAIIAVVAVAYVVVHHELLSNIDGQLRHQATTTTSITLSGDDPAFRPRHNAGESTGDLQLVESTGTAVPAFGDEALPVSSRDILIAANGGTWMRTTTFRGTAYRIFTVRKVASRSTIGLDGSIVTTQQVVALQVAQPLTAADSEQLHKLTLAFLLLVVLGFVMATVGTWFVVRRTMRPVATLTEAAEQIAVTRDLTTRIDAYGQDELGRLAGSFNTMLDALEKSLGQQRQLILDASHELRTPLASLRTNVEVLHDVERLSVDQRRALLDGIVTQLDQLTGLVADVVELARGEAPESAQEDLALDDLVTNAVARARRHWPNIVFMLAAEPVTIRGVPGRLDRAIANLLDNAGKFSPAGSVVDVGLNRAGVLTVADRGPGVPEASLEQVFDRFYRADEARALPGSGLGLAIVKQVVDGHRGTVALTNRPDGGTLVTATFPPAGRSADDVPAVQAHVEAQPVG